MQPVVIPAAPTTSHQVVRYNSKTSSILGGLQIVFGAICVLINVVGIVIRAPTYVYYSRYTLLYVGHGIWAGAFVSKQNVI